ncbi:MAG: hypothetical protein K8S25_12475 [Alphaproteobacteria bacterium]|nr:hypothetical protein [Alphaproteobacteria bacterium]
MTTKNRSPLRSRFDFDRQDKREMELEYFHSFQFLERDINSTDFVQAEAPDFRSVETERSIGVEVTRLFRQSARLDVESTKDRIVEEARNIAMAMTLPPADVTFFFSFEGKISAKRRRRIADATVRFVADHMPPFGSYSNFDGHPGQPREVDLILVNRVQPGPQGQWRWLEAGMVERDPSVMICEAIARKESKLDEYLSSCRECWLLLVADSFRPSGKLAIDESWMHRQFESSFARTYFLDFGRGHLHRLSTSAGDQHEVTCPDEP